MNITEVQKTILEILERFFSGATVQMANMSYSVKSQMPLLVVTFRDTHRVQHSIDSVIDGHVFASYPSELLVQLDLYTKGQPIKTANGSIIGSHNTAVADMVDFANYLGSPYFINESNEKEITIHTEGSVFDTTHLLDTTTFQYRSTFELRVAFVQTVLGYAGLLDSSSIVYDDTTEDDTTTDDTTTDEGDTGSSDSTGDNDDQNGTTDPETPEEQTTNEDVHIIPTFTQNVSGGGNEEIALEVLGYFVEAEIEASDEQ